PFDARRRRLRIEQPEHQRREQVELGEQAQLFDEGTRAVTDYWAAGSDEREALLRELVEQPEIELRLRATPHALEESEHHLGGARWPCLCCHVRLLDRLENEIDERLTRRARDAIGQAAQVPDHLPGRAALCRNRRVRALILHLDVPIAL